MTNVQECIIELHALTRDLQQYIRQEVPDIALKKAAEGQPLRPIVKSVPKETPPQPPQLSPAPKKPAPLPLSAKPKEKEFPKTALDPLMLCQARPFIKPAEVVLSDCIERLQKMGVPTLQSPTKEQVSVQHQLIMVSFFLPGSAEEAFIQKVAQSVSERILPCTLYKQPGLSAACVASTLCAQDSVIAVICCFSQELAPKLSEWLHYFGDDLQQDDKQQEQLISKKTLFNTSFYELILTAHAMQDPAFKRALWNDLQRIV